MGQESRKLDEGKRGKLSGEWKLNTKIENWWVVSEKFREEMGVEMEKWIVQLVDSCWWFIRTFCVALAPTIHPLLAIINSKNSRFFSSTAFNFTYIPFLTHSELKFNI